MKPYRLVASLIVVGSALVGGAILLHTDSRARAQDRPITDVFFPPVPPPPLPKNIVKLTPTEQLGKFMIFDSTLSNPVGYSCSSCHVPETGYTGPSSQINEFAGPMPGVVPGRSGPRKPYTYNYAAFSPVGPFFDPLLAVWIGGQFWDGRAADLSQQAQGPPINPNEMDNTPAGTFPHQFSPLLAQKLANRPYTPLIKQLFGQDVFINNTPQDIFVLFSELVAAYEASPEVLQFSSKYDAWVAGKHKLTASETRGMTLYFGGAQCFACHSSAGNPDLQASTDGRDTFTMYCFANIGVPKNPQNPFYQETDPISNPTGFNPLGTAFIDFGLGSNAVGAPDGTKFFNVTPGDIPEFRGLMLTPTTRSTDRRPSPDFVKAYMHNGVFKSLKQVVHFYNKRNIAVNAAGQEVAFDLRIGPPAGYTALFPPPEVLDNVQNVAGVTPANATADTASNGQVGNLGLSSAQEDDVVNFLKALTDGFTKPNPISP
jgi:cytochrome c peroxidase